MLRAYQSVAFVSLGLACTYPAAAAVPRTVSGYFTPNDQYQHVISTTSDGAVDEVYFNPTKGIVSDHIGCFGDIIASAAFYTPDDDFQHVIVATRDGNIREIFFNPGVGIHVSEPPLVNIPDVVAVAAFVTPDDHYRIVIIATRDGQIREIFYHPSTGVHVTQPALARFNDVVSIAGFATSDDKYRIVLAGTRDGTIHEVFYSPSTGVHVTHPALATFPGLVSLAGFQTGDDKYRIAIAATGDGNIHEVFYGPSIGVHITPLPLANLPGVTSVSGYFTSGDDRRHVIVSTVDGTIYEIFYNPRTGRGQEILKKYGEVGITQLELTQSIQDLNNSVPLFAGKRTLVRAYMNGGVCSTVGAPLVNVSVSAAIYSSGSSSPVWGPISVGPTTLPRLSNRDLLADSINFELPATGPNGQLWSTTDTYTLRVTAQPGESTGESVDVYLHFHDSVPFHFRVFHDDANGPVSQVTIARTVNRLAALWPVREVVMHDYDDRQSGITWGVLGAARTLALAGDQAAIAMGVEPPNCSSCFFITVPGGGGGLANPWPNHDSVVAMSGDTNQDAHTLAQEPSHNLGRLHASSVHGEQQPSDPSFPYPHGEISDNLTAQVGNIVTRGRYYGADPGTNLTHPSGQWWLIPAYNADSSTHHHDYMSYGGGADVWTSNYTYAAICGANRVGRFDSWYRRASDLVAGSEPPLPFCSEPSGGEPWNVLRYASPSAGGDPVEFLIVRGAIAPNGTVRFEPSYRVSVREHLIQSMAPVREPASGEPPTMLVLVDAGGETLGSTVIQPPTHGATFPFVANIRWNARTAAVVVRRDNRELGRMTRSPTPLTARLVSIPHGHVLRPVEVQWVTGSTGGQQPATAILFSADGGNAWQTLAMDITSGTWIFDPERVSGTRNGMLRLLISEGLNAIAIDGPADIEIDAHPPRVAIWDPANGATIPTGTRLVLRGSASSPQSGTLSMRQMAWYHQDRLLGYGSVIEAVGLSAGPQEVRLEATDTEGRRSVDRVTLILAPDSVPVLGDRPGTRLQSIR
jgi:hypothetical protein